MRINAIVFPSGRIARQNVRTVLIASSVKTDARRRISIWSRDLLQPKRHRTRFILGGVCNKPREVRTIIGASGATLSINLPLHKFVCPGASE